MDLNTLKLFVRQVSLEGFGIEGQTKLLNASVLVIGAGGLGCPVLQSLSAMGIGNIGIVDGDRIEASNLHRQMLYTREMIGQYKAEAAAKLVGQLGIGPQVTVWSQFLDRKLAETLFPQFDIIIDATDNFDSKYLIDAVACATNKPVCFASVNKYEGQLALFGAGYGWASYADAFPERTPSNFTESCADSGVLGVVPALIGSYQALFAALYISGQHQHLRNKLFFVNVAAPALRAVDISLTEGLRTLDEINFSEQIACAIPSSLEVERIDGFDSDICILDIREPHETALRFRDSLSRPKSTSDQWIDLLDPDRTYVLVCQSGKRSLAMVKNLRERGVDRTYSYFGGMNRALKDENYSFIEIVLP